MFCLQKAPIVAKGKIEVSAISGSEIGSFFPVSERQLLPASHPKSCSTAAAAADLGLCDRLRTLREHILLKRVRKFEFDHTDVPPSLVLGRTARDTRQSIPDVRCGALPSREGGRVRRLLVPHVVVSGSKAEKKVPLVLKSVASPRLSVLVCFDH